MDINMKAVVLPKEEFICDKCYYTNGNMAYCISIYKIKYIFDKNGCFKEMLQLSDKDFSEILIEKGMDPNNFVIDTVREK